MFLDFFLKLKDSKIPVSLNEFLTFLQALKFNFTQFDVNKFYYLARASLVKDEKLIDKFDIIFGEYFNSIERIEIDDVIKFLNIPQDWLKKLSSKNFSNEEIEKIKSLGSFEKLIETLKKRLLDQKKRHQGGNKWIGTSGTSPFGAYGYNPEGIRIGQYESRYRKAIKVWDKRIFKDFDETNELDNRGFQVALKRLRTWARTGIEDELDIESTIRETENGYLDIKTRKERENSIKILLFLDVGGSMDDYIELTERLFSPHKMYLRISNIFIFIIACTRVFGKNNKRRWEERFLTSDIFRTFGKEYKCIFVGDAQMSPYEILSPGGGNEHFNDEPGSVWLERVVEQWPSNLWINPTPKNEWEFSQSTSLIKEIFMNRMVPLTIQGIEEGTKILSK